VALLMLGVWLLVRHRAIAGAVLVALASLVKPYVIVALPSFWRPWDWRVPVAVAATIALCYLPYLGVGRGVLGFVTPGGYLGEEGFADGEGFWLVALIRMAFGNVPGLTIAYLLAAASMMVWLGVRAAWRTDRTPETTLRDIAVLLMAGMFVLSPNYPWYFLIIVPFVALGGGAPAWALTLAAPLLYRPLILPDNELAWKTLAMLPFVFALPDLYRSVIEYHTGRGIQAESIWGAGLLVARRLADYPVDIVAVRHEYFTEPPKGKRFEDFLKERMKGRSPVNARLDKQGRGSISLPPGSWWLHATLSGDEQLEWRLPVTVKDKVQRSWLCSEALPVVECGERSVRVQRVRSRAARGVPRRGRTARGAAPARARPPRARRGSTRARARGCRRSTRSRRASTRARERSARGGRYVRWK